MKKIFVFLFKFIKRIPEFAFKIGGTKKFQIGLTLILVSFAVFLFSISIFNYPEDYNRIDYKGKRVTSVGKSVNSYLEKRPCILIGVNSSMNLSGRSVFNLNSFSCLFIGEL